MNDMSREELEAILRANQQNPMQNVEQESAAAIKREQDRDDANDEVEFVSSRRVRSTPSRRDEVIVLD